LNYFQLKLVLGTKLTAVSWDTRHSSSFRLDNPGLR